MKHKRSLLSFVLLFIPLLVWGADPRTKVDVFTNHPWNFSSGSEFPGASGSFKVVEEEGKKAGLLSFDFTKGGLYVSATSSIEIPSGQEELRFRVKSRDWQRIMIRLIDSTGQCHQYEVPYADEGDWQLLRINLQSQAGLSFGGANDKKIHYPVKRLTLAVNHSGPSTSGDVLFADFMLLK